MTGPAGVSGLWLGRPLTGHLIFSLLGFKRTIFRIVFRLLAVPHAVLTPVTSCHLELGQSCTQGIVALGHLKDPLVLSREREGPIYPSRDYMGHLLPHSLLRARRVVWSHGGHALCVWTGGCIVSNSSHHTAPSPHVGRSMLSIA